MTTADELGRLWAELAGVPPGQRQWRARRLLGDSPLQRYAALRDGDDACSIIFESVTSEAPQSRTRFEAEGVTAIEQRDFASGRYRVVVSLERRELGEVFDVLAADLIEVVAGQGSVKLAWQELARRLDAWQACLRTRSRGLGREAQVGLYGELLCLTLLARTAGWEGATLAWQGPARGLHDFVFLARDFEVKTAAGAETRIHVSSLDQLDTAHHGRLVLLRPRLLPAASGRTLPELVGTVRESVVAHAPSVCADLEVSLLRAGYLDIDAPVYGERLVVAEFYGFEIVEGFPRLTRDAVDAAVVEADYCLDERALNSFRRDGESFEALLRV